MRKLPLTAAVAFAAFAAQAQTPAAQQQPVPQPDATADAASDVQPATAPQARKDPRDVDCDHRASWDEYRSAMMANFGRLDANKDDVLESAEMPQQPKPPPAGMRLTRAEFESQLRAGFDQLDANKDGYLVGPEFPVRK